MHTTETFSVHVPQIFFVSEIYACSFHANFKPVDLLFLNEIRMQISMSGPGNSNMRVSNTALFLLQTPSFGNS